MSKSNIFSWGSLIHYYWCSFGGVHYKSPVCLCSSMILKQYCWKGTSKATPASDQTWETLSLKKGLGSKSSWWMVTRIGKSLKTEAFSSLYRQFCGYLHLYSCTVMTMWQGHDCYFQMFQGLSNKYIHCVFRSQNHYQLEEIVVGRIVMQPKCSGRSLTQQFLIQFHKHL